MALGGILSEDQVAARYQVAAPTVRGWRRKRTGPRYFYAGRRVRYRLADVVALVLAHMREVDRPVGSRPGPAIHKGLVLLPASEGASHRREMLRAKHNLRKGRRRAERKAAGEGETDHG